MEIVFWTIVFIVSLAVLIKGADWFVEGSEKIGIAFKISPFIIGVTIVAVGTSFPELVTSIFAVLKGATEIVAANAIGSNISNVLLIIGLSAIVSRTLTVRRSLIDLDAPLLAAATIIFIFIAWDGSVVLWEGILLIAAFIIYLLYTIFHRAEEGENASKKVVEVLPSRVERRQAEVRKKEKLGFKVFLFLVLGAVMLAFGANYVIESVIKISDILKISASFIAITAVAVGTSLPELVVSVRAAAKKKHEIALGNIFGSNVFNILFVVGLPSLFGTLSVDKLTLFVGLPFLAVSTLLFIISGISKKIHPWEGLMYILIYILFVIKLCEPF